MSDEYNRLGRTGDLTDNEIDELTDQLADCNYPLNEGAYWYAPTKPAPAKADSRDAELTAMRGKVERLTDTLRRIEAICENSNPTYQRRILQILNELKRSRA